MIDYRNIKKIISIMVIMAFVCHFHSDIFLHAQETDDLLNLFNMAKNAYKKRDYKDSKEKLELVFGIITDDSLEVEKKDILGGYYLLLGAIYEKEKYESLAEENYRSAKKLGIEFIEGVDLNGLPIYERVVKVETYIKTQFQKAVDEYNNGQYEKSKSTLKQIIETIEKEGLEVNRKDILGKCDLLLGAICEKKGEKLLAEKNYLKAKEYSIKSIDGVDDLEELPIYKEIMMKGIIVKTVDKKKKKFPLLLVIAGVAVVVAAVLLLTKKKKEPSPPANPEFVTSTDSLNVPEGGTETFDVRLSAQPSSNVSVSVTRVSGDPDISIQSGSSLTFTTINWNQNQTVTLAASEDADTTSDTATIRLSASGITNKDITAAEQDNDEISFVTDTTSIIVREGRSASFGVKLSHQPPADIQATISRVSGDTDIYVQSGGSPNFTTSNWNVFQTTTLRASEDPDTIDGQATFQISANGVQSKEITAIEDENDGGGCSISVAIIDPSNDETVNGTVTIRADVSGTCAIDRVEFFIDQKLAEEGTDTSAPYSYVWHTSIYLDGPHPIRVVAYATTGETADDEIEVIVNNLGDNN